LPQLNRQFQKLRSDLAVFQHGRGTPPANRLKTLARKALAVMAGICWDLGEAGVPQRD
jgi:hypothetical protein